MSRTIGSRRSLLLVPPLAAALLLPIAPAAAEPWMAASPTATERVFGDAASAQLAPTATPAPATPRSASPTALPASPTAAKTAAAGGSPTPTQTKAASPATTLKSVATPFASSTVRPSTSPTATVALTATPAQTATPTRTPTATATATVTQTATQTGTPVELPKLGRANGGLQGWLEGDLLALDVPARTQFDGSEYQASNCGPTALAMVLEAFGVDVPTDKLRNLANYLQGTFDKENGIALDYLGEIAREAGLRPLGLRDGSGYRRWSVEDVRGEVRHGHPVITLVRMADLPYYRGRATTTEHYVVVVGLDGDRLLVNDSAMPSGANYRLPLAPAELERAWDDSSIQRQALAIGAGDGTPELNLPDPPTATPTLTATPDLTPRPGEVRAEVQIGAAQSAAPAPLIGQIVVNVVIPPTSTATVTPTPTFTPPADRWARPGEATPPADERWVRADAFPRAETTLVLAAAAGPAPLEEPIHWLVRFGIFALGALALRWTTRE